MQRELNRRSLHLRWLLLCATPALMGCWPGQLVRQDDFEYTHPAVRWIYRTGGQVGSTLYLVRPIRNTVHDLRQAEGCVVVEEGSFGCMEIGPWKPRYALDLQTGSLSSPKNTSDERSHVAGGYSTQMAVKVDENTELYAPGGYPCPNLYVGRPGAPRESFTRLLAMRADKTGLGNSISHLVRPAADVIVFNLGYHHVVCLDLAKLALSDANASSRSSK